MSLTQLLEIESKGFVYAMTVVIAWGLLTGSINLRGLLVDKSNPTEISPYRVQLLISTLFIAVECVRQIVHQGALISPGSGVLYLMGGSHLIYATGKILEKFPIRRRTGT